MVVIPHSRFHQLSPSARDEVIGLLLSRPADATPPRTDTVELDERYRGIDMDCVVDLTLSQVREFSKSASPKTMRGLRVFAEEGPVVSLTTLMAVLEMERRIFQGRTTKRTRTVTGDQDAYLLGWSEPWPDNGDGCYAVTPSTYRSLRQFFGMD